MRDFFRVLLQKLMIYRRVRQLEMENYMLSQLLERLTARVTALEDAQKALPPPEPVISLKTVREAKELLSKARVYPHAHPQKCQCFICTGGQN